jgi:Ca2+-binding EF-hand superfamily protein
VLSTIDGNGHEWICCEDLFKFMKNYQLEVNLRQVEKLVEVINSTLNGKITEEQLRWIVEGF